MSILKECEIKKYTRGANYCINVFFNYFQRTIDEYIKEDGLQLNPKFQRGYKWSKKQQISFLEFLIKGGKTESIKFNKPSWMNHQNIPKGDYDEMVCVDGLQRTNSILQLLNNKIKVFGYYWKDFDKPLKRNLDIRVDVNDLLTEKEVLQWYVDLNSGGTVHTKKEIDKVKEMIQNINKEI